MKELNIELSDTQFEYLASIGKRKGLSPEQILIDIFETVYPPLSIIDTKEKLQTLRKARGIWEDREDIVNSEQFVRKLRKKWKVESLK